MTIPSFACFRASATYFQSAAGGSFLEFKALQQWQVLSSQYPSGRLNNRRLAAFQQAGVPIPYQMATPQRAAAGEAWKFTTQNGGTSIRIRGQ